ncbi:hypothetical protein [Halofilum ochraceum]|uniref:hypothetical protein n=1 Tax=Halofilum ochraceum TaxID=1611323 RepID=UPI0008D9A3A1|nr:hypothetical protein [Halofilum ochraceum]
MAGLKIERFEGAVHGMAARLLERSQAQRASNADVRDGDLLPYRGTSQVDTLAKAGTIETLYRWAEQAWFHWPHDVDVVESPLPSDTEDRVYFTGDGVPKMTYAGLATSSGDGVYPSNSYDLGVPSPGNPPTITVVGDPDDENDIGEDRAYVYTYVTAKGEEGPPSDASAIKLWKPGQSIEVSGMEAGPGGNRNITLKRIYRTASGSRGTNLQYVDDIDVAATSYTDTVPTDDLGELLPSADWNVPPEDMVDLVAMPNGILIGHTGNQLVPSESYLPHAWPVDYRLQTASPIVAKAAIGNTLIVATEDFPEMLTGTDPSALALEKADTAYPCLSKRSMADLGFAAVYASTDGLVKFSQQGPELLTQALFTPEQWRGYAPESMHAYRFDDYYLVFYDTGSEQGGMIVHPNGRWVMFLDLYASAAWLDPKTGILKLVLNDNEVHDFDADGVARLTAEWRSKTFITPKPVNFAAAHVDAEAYPVTFRVYGDGQLKGDISVSDNRPFRLPGGYRADHWSFEIETDTRVHRFEVAETMEEIRAR